MNKSYLKHKDNLSVIVRPDLKEDGTDQTGLLQAAIDLSGAIGGMLHAPAAIKPNRADVGYYIRLSPEDKATLLKMGGARWVRACIELARKGETK